jgi:single-stranded-DNA-specific exonuclease
VRVPEHRWIVKEVPADAEAESIPALARALHVPELVARLLWLRDLKDEDTARSFLAPKLQDLEPPDVLPDMARASERLADAIRGGERIAVYGDYDVDGMTGTSLLLRFLRLAGGDAIWAIPDRDTDGYGLGSDAVDRLAAEGAEVIVTVDNGVSAHAAAKRALHHDIDLVVTDHHLPSDELPDAYAVVNPHRRDASGAGRGLCGCAVAFKTAWAVADRLRTATGKDAGRFRAFLRDAVGLVALATVSDVVPLKGENRIFVSAGLAALRSSPHPGVRALLECSRVGTLPLTTEDVAFRIGPRLNAAGRLSKPGVVIDLLTSTDLAEARRLARLLADANATRRRIEQKVLVAAAEQADELLAREERRSLVVHGEGWHRGVIGIVAARLVDRHQRPTVVIGFEGADGRGSCRSSQDVDLHEALTSCDPHLSRYGGHAAAAGLEIDRLRIDEFSQAFEEAVRTQMEEQPPARTIEIDAETDADDWNLDQVEAVHRLAPFGAENAQPLFLVKGAKPAGRPKLMGQNDAHLAFTIRQAGGALRVIAFRQSVHYDLVRSGALLDLVVAPMVNEWKGVRTAELRLVDIREAS